MNTPALRETLVTQGAEVTSGVDVPHEGLAAKLPTGMRLPTYLPAGFEHPAVNLNTWQSGASVSFFGQHTDRFVTVMYHSSAFGRDSMTATEGSARDIKEVTVKVNDWTALSYRDDSGWTLTWAMYGHQYEVHTNISAEEALKVAESIK